MTGEQVLKRLSAFLKQERSDVSSLWGPSSRDKFASGMKAEISFVEVFVKRLRAEIRAKP
jgi:hypothetical protein